MSAVGPSPPSISHDHSPTAAKTVPVHSSFAEAKDDAAICFICAEPITLHAVGKCNHRTCHVCALRLRALYKRTDCIFCKTNLERIIFTRSSQRLFDSFPPDSLPFTDTQLGIAFETQEQQETASRLLRFNCPEQSCGRTCNGWGELRRHVKREHKRQMWCVAIKFSAFSGPELPKSSPPPSDLCIRNQKIFAHEHALFTPAQLHAHIHSGEMAVDKPHSAIATRSGFTGHPACDFCRVHFYDADDQFKHLREKHEQCFLCVRSGARRMEYYRDWQHLDRHFFHHHHACDDPACKAEKFVVFESALDLQAHQIERHGLGTSKQARKDARRLEINFTRGDGVESSRPSLARPADQANTAASSTTRDVSRSKPVFVSAEASNGPNVMTPRRHVPGLGRERRSFPVAAANVSGPSQSTLPQPPHQDLETEHTQALLDHVNAVTGYSEMKMAAFEAAVRAYRASEAAASDLLNTFGSIFDNRMSLIEVIVYQVAALFDTPRKKSDLLMAWRDFSIDHDAFPSLAPSAKTLVEQAAPKDERSVSGTRVIPQRVPIDSLTADRNSHKSVAWARVHHAASSNSSTYLASQIGIANRNKPVATTAWSASAQRSSNPVRMESATASQSECRPGDVTFLGHTEDLPQFRPPIATRVPQALGSDEFPDLPTSTAAKRAAFGGVNTARSSAWGVQISAADRPVSGDGSEFPMSSKKKGKRRQLLYTM